MKLAMLGAFKKLEGLFREKLIYFSKKNPSFWRFENSYAIIQVESHCKKWIFAFFQNFHTLFRKKTIWFPKNHKLYNLAEILRKKHHLRRILYQNCQNSDKRINLFLHKNRCLKILRILKQKFLMRHIL